MVSITPCGRFVGRARALILPISIDVILRMGKKKLCLEKCGEYSLEDYIKQALDTEGSIADPKVYNYAALV